MTYWGFIHLFPSVAEAGALTFPNRCQLVRSSYHLVKSAERLILNPAVEGRNSVAREEQMVHRTVVLPCPLQNKVGSPWNRLETITVFWQCSPSMVRPWTEAEIRLLGTKPDYEIGRLIGRPGKSVWAKRVALGIASPPKLVRRWTEEEDRVVLSKPPQESAKMLNRTKDAVCIRRNKLLKKISCDPNAKLSDNAEAAPQVQVPRYDSAEHEEKVRFVGGPYVPPSVTVGGWLQCALHGLLQTGGYTNALIPWPVAVKHPRQMILCGDLVKALKTESRLAVCFHVGISPQMVSEYRRKLGIERLTPGSTRLFWRNVKLAGSDEGRAKMSQQREGRKDLMTPEDRARLRQIQRRPKTAAWKASAAERWQRRYAMLGKPEVWTKEELELVGTRPDRKVARLLNRSVLAVKAKKFQLKKKGDENSGPV